MYTLVIKHVHMISPPLKVLVSNQVLSIWLGMMHGDKTSMHAQSELSVHKGCACPEALHLMFAGLQRHLLRHHQL